MILVRQVFQVKYGCMDKVLALFKAMPEDVRRGFNLSRMLTDISGQNFTLVMEFKAESMNAYIESLQAMFSESAAQRQTDPMEEYIESGYKEFYTIEYESAG
jgi:hypothetical protein